MVVKNYNIIGIPPVTRLLRIERVDYGWRVWTGTRDFRVGSYIQLCNDGRAFNITVRADEGDEIIQVRPTDKEVES
jgi:hypothetical protein